MRYFLAVDVGGTKCELAVFTLGDTNYLPLAQKRYASGDFKSVEDVIELFLQESNYKPDLAALGVAGPVEEGEGAVTNLPWLINNNAIQQRFGFKDSLLINDLTAVCASISGIDDADKLVVHEAEAIPGEMIGVVAPGTGLGEGYLLENETLFLPKGSEGGHADFAPVNSEQTDLLNWMQVQMTPVSYEDLIAGPGIPSLFDFYIEHKKLTANSGVVDALVSAKDRTPLIVEGAFGENPCPVCLKTVELFLAILGSELGNLALKLYAKGGMYIGGGIVPRLVGRISFDILLKAYLDKGKMDELVASIPLYLINRSDAALIGVARYANHMWRSLY